MTEINRSSCLQGASRPVRDTEERWERACLHRLLGPSGPLAEIQRTRRSQLGQKLEGGQVLKHFSEDGELDEAPVLLLLQFALLCLSRTLGHFPVMREFTFWDGSACYPFTLSSLDLGSSLYFHPCWFLGQRRG